MAPDFASHRHTTLPGRLEFAPLALNMSAKNSQPGKPNEDYVLVDNRTQCYVVCDGVSRTPLEDGSYPNPSPAALAAKIGAEGIMKFLVGNLSSDLEPKQIIQGAAKAANQQIARLNKKLFKEIDYRINDFAGTCSIFGFVKDGNFHCGMIGDCVGYYVNKSNQQNLVRFTQSQTVKVRQYGESHSSEFKDKKSLQLFFRSQLRNNPDNEYAYGVLTGEENEKRNALQFVEYHKIPLQDIAYILLTSDGLDDFLKDKQGSMENLLLYPHQIIDSANDFEKNLGKEGDDKTFVLVDFLFNLSTYK
ncbi:MAG TPA: protein phosphatase 2C domain-containing protein [Oligoflexia bacterium]|nr:protein phosphatase 2C domain-containing protein [Oligoflexia bacterium]HMP27361.1 protein phosphatase 2C domain-containing protein [Oligoflexia bacterium]